jgi:hypothetical protein
MDNWTPVEDGGQVLDSAVVWLGDVRQVKVTKDGEEKTVFNFLMKTGFYGFKSLDYSSREEAEAVHAKIKSATEKEAN